MKHYTLEAVIDGRDIVFNKTFTSRNSAMKYISEYYAKNDIPMTIADEYPVDGNIHNIEYQCDYFNRFKICRI